MSFRKGKFDGVLRFSTKDSSAENPKQLFNHQTPNWGKYFFKVAKLFTQWGVEPSFRNRFTKLYTHKNPFQDIVTSQMYVYIYFCHLVLIIFIIAENKLESRLYKISTSTEYL